MATGPASRAPRTPRPDRRAPRPALIAGAVIAVLTIGGAAAGVALRGGDRPAPAVPTFAPLPISPAVSAPPSAPVAAPATAPTAAPSTADPADELQRQLDGDAATVESLVGKWIPQLSSKREGDVVDGTRYDAAAVLADFRSWQERVPSSVLTRSERFTSFRGQDYWVTLANEPFDTAAAANAWCVTKGLAPGDCFAKRLSHSEGPSGNTRPR
jgi:serine/threonine-protein kinase